MGLFKDDFVRKVEKMQAEAQKQLAIDLANTEMCEQGIAAEHEGNIEKAIEIYETLLKRKFDGTHPYRSLCTIYHKQKRFDDEIRVIKCLRKVTPAKRYKEQNKYRWYDKRYEELKSK